MWFELHVILYYESLYLIIGISECMYRMVEQKLPERAVSLFMKACEVAEVGSFNFVISFSLKNTVC